MKRILALILLVASLAFAQDTPKDSTVADLRVTMAQQSVTIAGLKEQVMQLEYQLVQVEKRQAAADLQAAQSAQAAQAATVKQPTEAALERPSKTAERVAREVQESQEKALKDAEKTGSCWKVTPGQIAACLAYRAAKPEKK